MIHSRRPPSLCSTETGADCRILARVGYGSLRSVGGFRRGFVVSGLSGRCLCGGGLSGWWLCGGGLSSRWLFGRGAAVAVVMVFFLFSPVRRGPLGGAGRCTPLRRCF